MHNPNNQRRPSTLEQQFKQLRQVDQRFAYLSDEDKAQIALLHQRKQLAKRIRRVARIAVVATRTGATSRQRRLLAYKRRTIADLRVVQQNQYRLVAAGFVAVFALTSLVMPLLQARDPKPITLDSKVRALIGDSRDDTKDYLKYDASKQLYSFELPQTTPTENSKHTGRNADAYSANLPQNADGGIAVTEKNSKVAVTITPNFFTANARKAEGDHLVYRSGTDQLIYTLKYNGLKEDIIIPKFQQADLNYSFKLTLPSGVEARLDGQGNIGIYTADSSLYGNITYGTDEDRAKVEKARENSPKTNLLMTIPYPVIKDSTGQEFSDRAKFTLGPKKAVQTKQKPVDQPNMPAELQTKTATNVTMNEYQLSLNAYNLSDLSYPISLDPTIQVSNAADFTNMNLDSGATVDTTNNLIKRSSLTGGSTGSWGNQANYLPANRFFRQQTTVYGGYVYMVAGASVTSSTTTTAVANVWAAPINGNGSLGTLITSSPNIPATGNLVSISVTAYNGYLYAIGGEGGTPDGGLAQVYYAKINNDHSVGSWSATASLQTARMVPLVAAYNGYIYAMGGCTLYVSACKTTLASTEYTKINADGSLVAWQPTANMNQATWFSGTGIYNGYIYRVGGQSCATSTCSNINTTEYAKLNADGTLGSWIASAIALPDNTASALEAYFNAGYLYYAGRSTDTTTVYYSQVNTDGSIGSWQQTTSFATGRHQHAFFIYNNNLTIFGGMSGTSGSFAGYTDVQYAPIDPVGTINKPTALADFDTSGREGASVLAARGAIYMLGGFDGTNYLNTIRKATINSDGTLGSWSTESHNLPKAKAYFSITVAPNGALLGVYGGYGQCNVIPGQLDYCNDWEVASYSGGIGTWTTSNFNLPTGRRGLSAVFDRNIVYLIGGMDSSGVLSDVLKASPSSGATFNDIGCGTTAWCTEPSFASARTDAAAVQDNNYIYLIGGHNGSTYYQTVQYALITTSNGALSTNSCGTSVTWCTTTSITTARATHSAFVRNGYIYIAAGCNTGSGCTADLNTIEFAAVNGTNGALGSWAANNQTLNTARSYASVASFDGFLYALGGNTGSSQAKDVQYAYIGNGGTGKMSSFTTQSGTALSSARTDLATTAYNGYVYVAGGCTAFSSGACSGFLANVEYAKLLADGSFSSNTCGTSVTWCSATSLPSATFGGGLVAHGGYLYFMGGTTAAGVTGAVDAIAINSDGSLAGSWDSPSNPPDLIAARTRFGLTTTNNYVYVLEGSDGSSNLGNGEYAQLLSNGATSSWTSFATPNSDGRVLAFVADGHLEYTGGNQSVAGQSTLLNSNGSISSWNQMSWINGFAVEPIGFTANGYVYVGGNSGNFQRFNLVHGGGIEPVADSFYTMSTVHDGGAGVFYNGFFYALGGCTAGTGSSCTAETSNVEYAGQQATPHVATFSKLYDFEAGVKPTKLITRGSKQLATYLSATYQTGNNTSTNLDNSGSFNDMSYGGANMQTISIGANRTLSQYLYLRYTLDDSQSATFPDAGNEMTITDFDLYFIPNAGKRLRNGTTFTNGVNRGLDVQPQ